MIESRALCILIDTMNLKATIEKLFEEKFNAVDICKAFGITYSSDMLLNDIFSSGKFEVVTNNIGALELSI